MTGVVCISPDRLVFGEPVLFLVCFVPSPTKDEVVVALAEADR
jgi:hypothetical protein